MGLIGWQDYNNRKERQKLIQAILSKSAQDMANFELAEKVVKIDPNFQVSDDLINIADLSDEEFQKKIIDREVG